MKRRIFRTLVDSLETRTLMAFGDRIDTFGVDGAVKLNSLLSNAKEIVVDSVGRAVVGGSNSIVRVSAAGVNDATFGTSGRIAIPATYIDHALGPTGLIYALVTASSGTVISRYTQNGKLDTAWATGGTALVTGNKSFKPQAIAIGTDGKPVVAGVLLNPGDDGSRARVYRLTSTGGADTTFDRDGSVDVTLGATTFFTPVPQEAVSDVRVVSGKVILTGASRAYAPAGQDISGQYVPAVYGSYYAVSARLTAGGALDTTYGAAGVARQLAAEEYAGAIRAVGTIDSAGVAVSVVGVDTPGDYTSNTRSRIAAAKFSAAGAKTYLGVAPSETVTQAPNDVTLLTDGRVVVVGSVSSLEGRLSAVEITGTGAFRQFTIDKNRDNSSADLYSYYYSASIAAASDGKVLIAAQRSDGLAAIVKIDASATSVPPGAFANARVNQIARDSQGGVHLAYHDIVSTKLTYAYRDPSGKWAAPVVVDNNTLSGTQLSIDVDSKNRPGIAYLDAKNSDLKLATFNGTAWTIRIVESSGSVGFDPSFQFTDDDSYAVTYYHKTRGDLRYALFKTGAWAIEDVETDGDTGRRSALVVQPSSRKFGIAYLKQSTNEIRFAYRNAQKKWVSEKIATTKPGADFITLDFSGYDIAHVAWYDPEKADLKLSIRSVATPAAGVWTISTVASAGTVGKYARIRANYWGGWSIVAWDQTNDQLVLYRDYNTPVTLLSGGQYASVVFNDYQIDLSLFEPSKSSVRVTSVY